MIAANEALHIVRQFMFHIGIAGGMFDTLDAAKILHALARTGEVAVVVRKTSGLTLILDLPMAADYAPVRWSTGEPAQTYAEYFREVVGGPPEKKLFYYGGDRVKEVRPAEILSELA